MSPVRQHTAGRPAVPNRPRCRSLPDRLGGPDFGEWCNGSTTGSEPVSLGSNPSSPVFISHAPRGFRKRMDAAAEGLAEAGQAAPPLTASHDADALNLFCFSDELEVCAR